jgi:Ca2+-binding EF-hand superfamily protein
MAFANSLFKRQKSRKPSLGTTELDYLTQNTELKDREMLRFHFDSFIEKHPKGCISKREFRDITGKVYPSKDYAKIEKRIFNMYDKNGDGTISFRELMLVMFVMSDGTPEQNLRQIFKV